MTALSPLILPFDSPEASLALVGGKGANLSILSRAGFPVPGGFLVTTEAYCCFVSENRLGEAIDEALATVQPDNPASLEATSTTIRQRFMSGAMPEMLRSQLLVAYEKIGHPPVAVRSSATAEDLPDMSFAGQQDTYLNIIGEDALVKAVISCWGSLWTARAIGYRARNSIDHMHVSLSVVVQEMVQSEASGVLFTANPLNGKRTETVIDATLGLGEALVSGQVEPDHYIVETRSRKILRKTLGAKALTIVGSEGGGTNTIHESAADRQAIPDSVIAELAALGQRVAEHYHFPQDIEWGWTKGKLYLLQARPITSLFPLPVGAQSDPPWIMFSFGAVQGMLDPMTPLGRDTMSGILGGIPRLGGINLELDDAPLIRTAGERLWIRIDTLLGNQLGRKAIRGALDVIEPSAGQAVDQLLRDARLSQEVGLPQPDTFLRFGRAASRIVPKIVGVLIDPRTKRQEAQQRIEAFLAEIQQQMDQASTLAEKVTVYANTAQAGFSRLIPYLGPCLAVGMITFNRLLALSRQYLDNNRSLLEVTRGLPNNVTTEMDLILWETARKIKADAVANAAMSQQEPATLAEQYLARTLPATAQRAITAFMQRYGMRGLAEIDLGRPRWRENPIQVMQMVQNYLRIDDPELAPDAIFKKGEQAAEQAIATLVAAVERSERGVVKAQVVRFLASRMRELLGLRETPKFMMVRLMGIMRQGFLQSGAELVQKGVLESADDLFFLHYKELLALANNYAIDWKALVAERRALYAREKLRRQIPRLLVGDGQAFYDGVRSKQSAKDGVLIGSPVSPGVVEGAVRVVFDPHHADLQPGEILVCPGTDPAWTPLFLAAGGLVMEVGGLMTHGSVVAREYGIPAVVGVEDVTQRLKTGQRIRVDGSTGEVAIL
ncbi:MAG: PEP/pyruvate-binding domain-containing protein [Caldilineaceae bacterium]